MTNLEDLIPIRARYQYARLMYQYKKLPKIRGESDLNGNIEFELFSFFEICYHLKDWIKLDKALDKEVEEFINNTPALRICADICNRLKHGELEKRTRSKNLGAISISMHVTVGMVKQSTVISSAKVETERGLECCFALADECVQAWQSYILNIKQ